MHAIICRQGMLSYLQCQLCAVLCLVRRALQPCIVAFPPLSCPLVCSIAGPASTVLASKCLKGKPATIGKTAEACMLLIELEQQGAVLEAVLKAFGDKVPKVVQAAVDIVLQAVR